MKYNDDDGNGVFPKQTDRKRYNSKYQKTYSNRYYVPKNDYIKGTRIRRTYSERKGRSTCYFYLNGSLYCDAQGSSQLRLRLHDAIINAALRIGGVIDKLEFYRHCPPRRLKDTHMTEFEKCEFVSSVMTIASVLHIHGEKWVLWQPSC